MGDSYHVKLGGKKPNKKNDKIKLIDDIIKRMKRFRRTSDTKFLTVY